MRVGVLDWHQSADERARTYMAKRDADLLVERLAAERLKNGLIRMFSPDSVFYFLRPVAPQIRFIPTKLPPVEVEDCHFLPPKSSNRSSSKAIREQWNWAHDPWPKELLRTA